jgi:hypothetical protein
LQSLEFTKKRSVPKVRGQYIAPEKTVEDILGGMIFEVLKDKSRCDEILMNTKHKLEKVIYGR